MFNLQIFHYPHISNSPNEGFDMFKRLSRRSPDLPSLAIFGSLGFVDCMSRIDDGISVFVAAGLMWTFAIVCTSFLLSD